MNHEGKDCLMSHGHDINCNHMKPCNRGVYALQANSGKDDDSTLTQMVAIASVETHMTHVCTVVGCVGQKATYYDTALKLLIEADMNWTHIHCIPT